MNRARRQRVPVRLRLENLESRQLLASLVVTSTADSGAGTLRQAIIDSNSASGSNTIDFDIPGTGVQTISLLTALPALVNPTIIDGTSQPGYAGTPLIDIDGANILDTTVTPPAPVPNVTGLDLTGGSSLVEGLTITRFTGTGIVATRNGNTIAADFIGTDATGSSSLGNGGDGVVLTGRGNVVGGAQASDRNVISGNTGTGLYLGSGGALPSDTIVQGNYIGTDATGTLDLGNSLAGIDIESSDNSIGGASMSDANVIAFNGGAGVQVGTSPYVSGVIGNRIANNSIFSNVGLGIDLGNDGVTPIDPYQHTSGPNQLQNYPTITSAYPGAGGGLTVEGNLLGSPDSTYTIDFYTNLQADPSGYGQGLDPIGTSQVTTDASGLATFTLNLASATSMPGQFITATATDSAGDTSEFSKAVSETQTAQVNLSVLASNPNPTPQAGVPETYSFLVQNTGPSIATNVVFTDMLPVGATNLSVSVGQGTFSLGNGTVTADIGSLASGASAFVDITFTLLTTGTVTNTASVTSDQTNTSMASMVSQSLVVSPGASVPLTLSGVANNYSVQAGQPLTYTFVISNPSYSEATGVTFSDPLPEGVVPTSVMPSQGTYSINGNDVVVSLGALPAGSTAAVTLVVQPTTPGFLANFAMISADQPNPNALNTYTTVYTYVTPAPSVDLAVVVQAAPMPAVVGQLSALNLLVGNQGSAPATDVTLTDILPTAAVVTGIHPSQGTFTLVGDVLTVDLGGLGVGAIASVTIGYVAGAPGFLSDSATVFANETEQDITNNFAQVTIPVINQVIAPTIIGQNLIVSGNKITGVVLTYDEDMDSDSASMIANFEVLSLGQNSSLTATGPKVAIASARYNAVERTTTITFKTGLNIGQFYKVVANGPGAPGLVDASGNVLDGENNGLSNSIYQSIIGRGTTKRPVQLQVGVPAPKPTPVAKASSASAHKATVKHH